MTLTKQQFYQLPVIKGDSPKCPKCGIVPNLKESVFGFPLLFHYICYNCDHRWRFEKIIKPASKIRKIKNKIYDYISKWDEGDGVASTQIAKYIKMDVFEVIKFLYQLTEDIRIYQSQPGYFSCY